ncbi:phage major capsid protein [Streptomyces sp. SA15]|uniref:phage major capsid protein n=1 Tax=Streptomyces sp. SA15 TaxID=934019 RepID=UPI000BAF3554|nr:phage major capsid protein [Streptomyces sp. SA15]PAZ15675.1 phage major capsid protein [Streptomyces sp. SA15]
MTATLDAERIVEFPALVEAKKGLDAKRDELAKIFDEAGPDYDMTRVKSIAGDTHAKVDHIRTLNAEIDQRKSKVDELLVVARAAAVAKRGEGGEPGSEPNDRKGTGKSAEKKAGGESFGRLFVESPAFKQFARGAGGGPQASIDIELKSLFSTGSWDPETTRTGRIEMFPTRPAPRVADLVPQTTTMQAAVVYMEETTFTNTAAETAEGDQFPEAALGLEEKSVQVRKIPVFLPVTDETFEDEPRAESYVQNRLPFMIRQRLDLQILRGSGTAPNLLGTENVSGILSQAKGADPVPDALYKGMRRIRDTGFAEPSVVFITPEKWEPVRLLRTADGIYIWGHPSTPGPATIWGVPVVETTAAPSTKALLGDYTNFSELAVRRGIDVQVSNSHGDFFVRGKLAVRADIRCAVIHYRPSAFCEVTGL